MTENGEKFRLKPEIVVYLILTTFQILQINRTYEGR
jgi:hypothetical protein